MAYANPDFSGASAVIVKETFETNWSAALEGGASSGGQAAGDAEMYLYLKNVSAGSVIIADLGLELAPGAEMIAASSSPEDDSDLYPFSSAEIRKSKSLDYVISASSDLKFKWAEADSFELDSAQSADKKWNPQRLQLADLQTESLEVGSLEAVSSVSADSVSADTVSLDGDDLGSKLIGLDSTDIALSAATEAEAARAAAAEAVLSAENTAEATRAASAEVLLDGRLDTVEGSGAGSIAKAVADESTALKAGEIATAQAAAAAADAKAVQAQSEIDTAEIAASALSARVTGEENLSATQNSRLTALESSDSSTATVVTNIQTSATATAQSAANNATNHATLVSSAGNTQSALTAEISARSVADTAEANTRAAADTAAASDRTAVRGEFADADTAILLSISGNDADILALQNSLADVISNTDPAAIDSLTEIVAEFQSADGNLSTAISNALGTHTSELNSLKDGSSSSVKDLDDDIVAVQSASATADTALDDKIDALEGDDIGVSLGGGSTPYMDALYPGSDDVQELLEKEATNTYLAAKMINGIGAAGGWDFYKNYLQSIGLPAGAGSLITMVDQVIADAAANASAIASSTVDRNQNEADADASFVLAATARGNIASDLSDESDRAGLAEVANAGLISAEEAARIADVNSEEARAQGVEATIAAAASAAAQDAADEATRAVIAETALQGDINQNEIDSDQAVSDEAAARASSIAALRIETFHHMGSESGYASSMYLKSGDMPSNMNSPRFTAPSACDEFSVSFSEDLPGACDVEIKLVGDDGSIKATETVACAQGESYKSGSMSMAPVAGDRLSFKISSGVCKDPVVSVSCSKNP